MWPADGSSWAWTDRSDGAADPSARADAEGDFGEFQAFIAGALRTCRLFVMRLSHSGRAFRVALVTQAQEAFLEEPPFKTSQAT